MVRELYRKIVPRKIRVILEYIRKKEIRKNRERRKRYGSKNPETIFYVIRVDANTWGLLTTVFFVFAHLDYAIEKGYVPIIDLKNYCVNMIQDRRHFGLENAWEYYFEQPSLGVTLEEVYNSKTVILGRKGFTPEGWYRPNWNIRLSSDDLKKYHLLETEYLRPSQEIRERIAQNIKGLFPKEGKVMGVSVRRGYARGEIAKEKLYVNHPKQADLEEYVYDIDDLMQKWKCEFLFISVDDRETSDFFAEKYGNKCIRMNRSLRHFFYKGKALTNSDDVKKMMSEIHLDEIDVERTTKEYLTEVYLLAQCDCLLASISSSSQMACIINGGQYEHVKIYDKGLITLEEKK